MAVKPFNVMDLGKTVIFNPEEMGYRDSLDVIKDESVKIQKSFVKIGWYLKHIKDYSLYREDGYADIYECAADQLGYSQSTVSRFIKICEKFSKDHNSPELDEKYSDFDRSQMMEMLPMGEEQLEKVTSDMTVKQIRSIKKDTTENEEIVRQTSLEKDFSEYMPDTPDTDNTALPNLQKDEYATSHKNDSRLSDPAKGGNLVDKAVVIDAEYTEIREQPKLPVLKNDKQRKKWLADYKAWGLWYRDENIDVNYYKFTFEDGSCLIVAEYLQRPVYYSNEIIDEHFYHLLQKKKRSYYGRVFDEKYMHHTISETELVAFLKKLQQKAVEGDL